MAVSERDNGDLMSIKKDHPNGNIMTQTQGLLFDEKERDGSDRDALNTANNGHPKRKLQLCNGYLLQFDQLARVINAVWENRNIPRISHSLLAEATGLPARHVESLVSMGSAMGLIRPRVQIPTIVGALISRYDMFFEKKGSLEWCHFKGAGSYRNLVWFDVFNRLLVHEAPMTRKQWTEWFRRDLSGQYSDRTIRKVLQEEVNFVADAYLNQGLAKLNLVQQSPDGTLRRRRYTEVEPLVLCAMLYNAGEAPEQSTLELDQLTNTPGMPASVFGIDGNSLRQLVDDLHGREWLRYETTHNLDQIRLKPGYDSIEFLTAYYAEREPHPGTEQQRPAHI